MRMSREHDPDEPAEKRSKTVTNLAGITGKEIIFGFKLFRETFHIVIEGAGGYPSQKPERQTKPTSQLGQH